MCSQEIPEVPVSWGYKGRYTVVCLSCPTLSADSPYLSTSQNNGVGAGEANAPPAPLSVQASVEPRKQWGDPWVLCKVPGSHCPCTQPDQVKSSYLDSAYLRLDIKNLPESSGRAWPSRDQLGLQPSQILGHICLGVGLGGSFGPPAASLLQMGLRRD